MSLKTYDRVYLDSIGGGKPEPWPFKVVGGCPDPGCDKLAPGVWVTHVNHDGHGMIVAINDDQLTVLWSVEPRGGFSSIAFPTVRRVQPQLIANQLVSIQPMTAPSGLIFYLDYTYGDLDKKCSEGPLRSRLYWRAVRLWRTRIRSRLSSLYSWFRSQSTKRFTTAERNVFGPRLAPKQLLPTQESLIKALVTKEAAKHAHDSPQE